MELDFWMWMFLVVFMIHNFEEIFTANKTALLPYPIAGFHQFQSCYVLWFGC